jgi:hypothetical protein
MWGAIGAFIAALFSFRKKGTPPETPEPDEPTGPEDPDDPEIPDYQGGPREPLYVGKRGDPELEGLLAELEDAMRQGGVDPTLTAREVTLLPKWGKYAIPQRVYWPSIIRTGVELWNPIRRAMDEPLSVRGYRPPDYNEARKGELYIPGKKRGSAHMYAEALDIYATGGSKSRRKLALVTATVFNDRGEEIEMGFGAYGKPTPSNVHVDCGWRQRTWRDARYYIAEAKKVS